MLHISLLSHLMHMVFVPRFLRHHILLEPFKLVINLGFNLHETSLVAIVVYFLELLLLLPYLLILILNVV